MEHEEKAEEMERDVARMEHDSDKVGAHIDEARSDWEAKEQDQGVPGAQPDHDEEDEMTETPREESDQLPEEAPADQVADDDGGGGRDNAEDSPGVPGDEETATGNPDAAGAEDPDADEDD